MKILIYRIILHICWFIEDVLDEIHPCNKLYLSYKWENLVHEKMEELYKK